MAGDYDMEAVAQIMDTRPVNEAVIAHWSKHAWNRHAWGEKTGNRQTVVFCSTVEHARHVQQSFLKAGFPAALVHGEMSSVERERNLLAYTRGNVQVIVNVAVLMEGWDHPPTSCIVLLRPSSHKAAFIQMVGRGLRPVNPEEHPGVVKNDCVVLDFGATILAHGSLEQDVELEDKTQKGEAPVKACPECDAPMPAAVAECPLCGFAFESRGASTTRLGETDFTMREINIFERSPFAWIDVDGKQDAFMASGYEAWGGVFFIKGQWCAIGALKRQPATLLAVGDKAVCFAAANDWMNRNESDNSAYKVKKWISLPATGSQLKYLPKHQNDYGLTRYKASVLMVLKFNRTNIKNALYAGGIL